MSNKHLILLKKELCPATGCTEPIAIAYGAALLMNTFKFNIEDISDITLYLSLNIFKNASGVGIPGTSSKGIPIAFALGLLSGDSTKKLNVLSNLSDSDISMANNFIRSNKINIKIAQNVDKLFIKILVKTSHEEYTIIIENSHTNVSHLSSSHEVKIDNHNQSNCSDSLNINTSIVEIFNFIKSSPIEDIYFLKESINLNKKIAIEGINNSYGLEVGKTIISSFNNDNIDIKNLITSMTSSASDARMGGSKLPVMTNSGSGNQGITTSVPVIYFSEYLKSSEEDLLRAIALSNLIAIHLKQKLGKLSALCGVIISAIGASCGMVFLRGGTIENINFAIKNMIGNISGMICDGAKNSCALKVATVTEAAYNSMILALNNKFVSSIEGIVEKDIEKSIDNLISIGKKGMEETDKVILDIMLSKQ